MANSPIGAFIAAGVNSIFHIYSLRCIKAFNSVSFPALPAGRSQVAVRIHCIDRVKCDLMTGPEAGL